MKNFVLATALLSGSLITLQNPGYGHGGTYRGPGDTVPPAGGGGTGGSPGGPAAPGPNGPSSPGGRGGPFGPGVPGLGTNGPATGTSGPSGDLNQWSFWWEFNKEPYLALKSNIHSGGTKTGLNNFWLGRGQTSDDTLTLAPTASQIHQLIVPALKAALANESNNDIITGAMIALAKIGDVRSESGTSEIEALITPFLRDSVQEIRETAAVSLGILASHTSIGILEHLLNDSPGARAQWGNGREINYRTRAFAAYGLGLIGARNQDDLYRRQIVDILVNAIERDDTKSRDLKVASIISLGLVPITQIEADQGSEDQAGASRVGQLEFLHTYLNDTGNQMLVRAHCPTALARLVSDAGDNGTLLQWKERLANDFSKRASKGSKESNEAIQSAVIGLGLVGDNSDDPSAKSIRKTLVALPGVISNQQARNYSLISLAKAGGTQGLGDHSEIGIGEISDQLTKQLTKGKRTLQPWAGLGIGILGNKLQGNGDLATEEFEQAATALRDRLRSESNTERLGAYAIATGIMRDVESEPVLLEHLEKLRSATARGYVALSLGLMRSSNARDPLRELLKKSQYKPELLKQAAVALGLLGDHEVGPLLVEMLQEESGYATKAALSSALGFIGDTNSVEPLVAMLENENLAPGARGFAAVALGIVADKELLPWNSKIAEDLNYRASTSTLVDNTSGTGILDIL